MASLSKNVHNDKLGEIVNKYNNTYQRAIKMKPVNVNSSTYIVLIKKIRRKNLTLKLVIIWESQNIKIFVTKSYTPNWPEEDIDIKKS